jgi:hypothetical protein
MIADYFSIHFDAYYLYMKPNTIKLERKKLILGISLYMGIFFCKLYIVFIKTLNMLIVSKYQLENRNSITFLLFESITKLLFE